MKQSFLCFLLFVALGITIEIERTTIIQRHLPPQNWKVVAYGNPEQRVDFTILLKQNNLNELSAQFKAVSDPKSPKWGQFMKPEEIEDLLKPSQETMEAISKWLSPIAQESKIKYHGDRIAVRTSVNAASRLFDTQFAVFYNAIVDKSVLRVLGKASVPSYLAEHIDFVAGISEFFSHDLDKEINSAVASFTTSKPKAVQKKAAQDDIVITPPVLKKYYKVNATLGVQSSNILQGIAAFTDYFSMGALLAFDNDQNLTPPTVKRIGPDCLPNCDQYESDLDIQYITAMAIGAKTVFLNQAADYWILEFALDAQKMSPQPQVFSISYGWSELLQCDIGSYYCAHLGYNSDQYVARTNTELQKLAVAGVSVLVSDGDDGSPSLGGASGNCPIDIDHWCPTGGCEHTSSMCGSFIITKTSKNLMCIFPMGMGSDGCQELLNDQAALNVLNEWVNKNAKCNINFETDNSKLPHFYSSCKCSALEDLNSNGYSITRYSFDSKNGPVFTADYPASSPFITSVGATQFLGTESDINEVVCSILTGATITTGGGFSSFQEQPDYQASTISKYLNNNLGLPPRSTFDATKRAYPDIAFNGHNYKIFYSTNSTDSCPCEATQVDGTSCSSPALAGLITLINSELLARGKSQLGFLNYLLYQMAEESPETFTDIVSGNNNCNRGYCCLYGYSAVRGYDAASGLGSPNFSKMLEYVLQKKGAI